MCHPLVLGSVAPLPISKYAPQRENEEDGQIYVTTIGSATFHDAQAIFPIRQLYYIYARHTGDACGFRGEYKDAIVARAELAVFLGRCLEHVSDLQLYVADSNFGNSGVIPTTFEYIGPSDICTWIPGFVEGDFFQVISDE